MGSKNIFSKRLKTLKIPSAPKKSPRCPDFMKIPKGIYQDNFSFLNCSIWLKNGRLVKKTVLDSQKGEKRHFDHNFFKIGHSELFIGLFCLLLTHWWYKIVIWQIPDAIRKSVWVDMELPNSQLPVLLPSSWSRLCSVGCLRTLMGAAIDIVNKLLMLNLNPIDRNYYI